MTTKQCWTDEVAADYGRRQRAGTLGCAAAGLAPPLCVVLLLCSAFRDGADPPFGLLLPFLLLLGSAVVALPLAAFSMLVVTAIAMHGFRCPRCGQRFSRPLLEASRCQSCGLPAQD